MSRAEVAHGQAVGVVYVAREKADQHPFVHKWLSPAEWQTCCLGSRHATPWDALGVM